MKRIALPLLLCAAACHPAHVAPTAVIAAKSMPQTHVAIFKSSASPLFEGPIHGFLSRFPGEVAIYDNVQPSLADALEQSLAAAPPQVIFCLGNAAAGVAKARFPKTPVLFALVPDEAELGLAEQPNFFGVSIKPPPLMEFTQFRMAMPALKRVLTFYRSPGSKRLLESNKEALQQLGFELTAVQVANLQEIQEAYRQHQAEVEAVWIMADAVVVEKSAFDYLLHQSLQDKKALLTSLTDLFAHAGALMSASVDLTSLGSQAALLALRVMVQGTPVHDVGVQPPIGVKLSVNLATANAIGVTIDPLALSFINRVYKGRTASR